MLHSVQWKRIFWLVQIISFFLPGGNVFLNESFILAIGLPIQWKLSTLFESFFLVAKTITDMSGNHFLKTELILAIGNHFLPLSQTIFKELFIPAIEKHFSIQKKKYCFLLPYQWKPLFKIQKSLFKTLISAIGNDFL